MAGNHILELKTQAVHQHGKETACGDRRSRWHMAYRGNEAVPACPCRGHLLETMFSERSRVGHEADATPSLVLKILN